MQEDLQKYTTFSTWPSQWTPILQYFFTAGPAYSADSAMRRDEQYKCVRMLEAYLDQRNENDLNPLETRMWTTCMGSALNSVIICAKYETTSQGKQQLLASVADADFDAQCSFSQNLVTENKYGIPFKMFHGTENGNQELSSKTSCYVVQYSSFAAMATVSLIKYTSNVSICSKFSIYKYDNTYETSDFKRHIAGLSWTEMDLSSKREDRELRFYTAPPDIMHNSSMKMDACCMQCGKPCIDRS